MLGEGLLLFVFILLIAGIAGYALKQKSQQSLLRWSIEERPLLSYPNKIGVYLKWEGEFILIGSPIDINDSDFNYKIEELRCEAQERLVAMKHLPYKT